MFFFYLNMIWCGLKTHYQYDVNILDSIAFWYRIIYHLIIGNLLTYKLT